MRRRDYESAVNFFSKVVYECPGYARAWIGRACAYRKLGRYEQACMDYRKAVAALSKEALRPEVFIVVAVCEDCRRLLKVYPHTASGYRYARRYMERVRKAGQLPQRRWGECYRVGDLELHEGNDFSVLNYASYTWVWSD